MFKLNYRLLSITAVGTALLLNSGSPAHAEKIQEYKSERAEQSAVEEYQSVKEKAKEMVEEAKDNLEEAQEEANLILDDGADKNESVYDSLKKKAEDRIEAAEEKYNDTKENANQMIRDARKNYLQDQFSYNN